SVAKVDGRVVQRLADTMDGQLGFIGIGLNKDDPRLSLFCPALGKSAEWSDEAVVTSASGVRVGAYARDFDDAVSKRYALRPGHKNENVVVFDKAPFPFLEFLVEYSDGATYHVNGKALESTVSLRLPFVDLKAAPPKPGAAPSDERPVAGDV